jgi:hypothetical protein
VKARYYVFSDQWITSQRFFSKRPAGFFLSIYTLYIVVQSRNFRFSDWMKEPAYLLLLIRTGSSKST